VAPAWLLMQVTQAPGLDIDVSQIEAPAFGQSAFEKQP
jgi:hypothetical protein